MIFSRKPVAASVAALAGVMSLAVTALPAMGQSSQRVEVTGSSIKRIGTEGTAPIQTFSQEDIQRSGVTSVTDFIQQLPVMQGFTPIASSVGGSGGGVTTASIHDLGEQYTLVLLNGRRVAPAGSGTTIDLNSIPLAAIERIEVLTDGASSIYGSDAIAGVVNFILKRGAQPLSIDVRASRPVKGGAAERNASISAGWGDLDKAGYELFFAASLDRNDRLASKQREFSKTGIISGETADGLTIDFFNGSSRSIPPNVDVSFRNTSGGVSRTSFSPYLLGKGECPPDHVRLGRQCYFDYVTTVEIYPELERKSVYTTGKLKLTSTWTGFGELAVTDVSTVPRIAPYPAEFSLARTSPLYAKYIRPYITDAQDAGLTSINVKYRLYELGSRTFDYNTKATHAVGGVEGSVAGWDVTAALTQSGQVQDNTYKAGFPLDAAFSAAINSGKIDPFNYPLGTLPADQLQLLRGTSYVGNYNTTKINMDAADFNAQRPFMRLGGGDAVVSIGGDVRHFSYKFTPNPAVANAEILFDDPQPKYAVKRNSVGGYAEVLLPLTKTVEAQASTRFDRVSGVTDELSNTKFGDTQSATTYKAGLKWKLTPDVLIRASYGTGFRVSSMLSIAQPRTDAGVTSGTYKCPFNASYDPLGYFKAGYVCPDNLQYEAFSGGNPALKPERSKQGNIGLVMQATESISTGLNFWAVDVRDAVSAVSEALILGNASRYLGLYTTKTKVSNGLTYVAILSSATNIGLAQNSGIDWDLAYRSKVGGGDLSAKITGTHMLKSRYTLPGTTEFTDSMDKFGANSAVTFRNIIKTTLAYRRGAWDNALTVNYRGAYRDQFYTADDCFFLDSVGDCAEGALKVPAHVTVDIRSSWAVTKNVTVVGAVQNLMDTPPPLSLQSAGSGHQLGYDPRYASPLGRTVSLQASYRF